MRINSLRNSKGNNLTPAQEYLFYHDDTTKPVPAPNEARREFRNLIMDKIVVLEEVIRDFHETGDYDVSQVLFDRLTTFIQEGISYMNAEKDIYPNLLSEYDFSYLITADKTIQRTKP